MRKVLVVMICFTVWLVACAKPSDSTLGRRDGYHDGEEFARAYLHCRMLHSNGLEDDWRWLKSHGFSGQYIQAYFAGRGDGCKRQLKIEKWRERQAQALRSGLISRLATEGPSTLAREAVGPKLSGESV